MSGGKAILLPCINLELTLENCLCCSWLAAIIAWLRDPGGISLFFGSLGSFAGVSQSFGGSIFFSNLNRF